MSREKPKVRFLPLKSGQRLAYSTHGSGPPLVCPAWWVSHLEEDWRDPRFRELFGGLANGRTVIRYDRPGAGLSDRARSEVDLEGEVETLAQLVDHLQLEPFALFAVSCAGPPALQYAAQYPERVTQLIFFGSFIRGEDVGPLAIKEALQGLVRAHWGMGSRALTNLFAPELSDADVKQVSRQHRNAASAEMAARLLSLTFDVNVSSVASQVKTPVLVLHREEDKTIRPAAGRELAACLPDATFELLPGTAHVPWLGEASSVLSAVKAFLGQTAGELDAAETTTPTENAFRLQGDVWTLTYRGQSVHLKQARGLMDLAILLTHAGEEVHVAKLWSGADSAAALGGGADPMLDETALAAYRARFQELESALGEAEESGSAEATERLRQERETLGQELRSAVGLGGRRRELGSPSERARKAVSARIRASIKKIRAVHPALGKHLESSVTTGSFCAYCPDEPVEWVFADR